jgi:glutamate formiminotransferase
MSSIPWTPFCSVQKTLHPIESSFCPYCGATNSSITTAIVDLTGSSPISRARTTVVPVAEAAREAANQRIRDQTVIDTKPHSGQSITIGRRSVLPVAPHTNSRQPQTQHIQAY